MKQIVVHTHTHQKTNVSEIMEKGRIISPASLFGWTDRGGKEEEGAKGRGLLKGGVAKHRCSTGWTHSSWLVGYTG